MLHYKALINKLSDLQQARYLVDLVTIEVGSLGHLCQRQLYATYLRNRLIPYYNRQLVLPFPACSYRTFNSRTSLSWDAVDLLNTVDVPCMHCKCYSFVRVRVCVCACV